MFTIKMDEQALIMSSRSTILFFPRSSDNNVCLVVLSIYIFLGAITFLQKSFQHYYTLKNM